MTRPPNRKAPRNSPSAERVLHLQGNVNSCYLNSIIIQYRIGPETRQFLPLVDFSPLSLSGIPPSSHPFILSLWHENITCYNYVFAHFCQFFQSFSSSFASHTIAWEDVVYFTMKALIQKASAQPPPRRLFPEAGRYFSSITLAKRHQPSELSKEELFSLRSLYKDFETVLTLCRIIYRAILTLQEMPRPLILYVPSTHRYWQVKFLKNYLTCFFAAHECFPDNIKRKNIL